MHSSGMGLGRIFLPSKDFFCKQGRSPRRAFLCREELEGARGDGGVPSPVCAHLWCSVDAEGVAVLPACGEGEALGLLSVHVRVRQKRLRMKLIERFSTASDSL